MIKQLVLVLLAIFSSSAYAEVAEEKGLRIAQEVERRDEGWGDSQVAMEMILSDRRGTSVTRRLRLFGLEMASDGDKSLIIFDDPLDVKGTALLTFSHKTDADDQWLYLPAVKRVKKIASKNKSGPFLGSEFAFEDLTSQEVEKYRYRYLRDDEIDGSAVFVIERTPMDPYSGYTRQLAYIDQKHYRISKVEYFDRKNAPLKVLYFCDYKQYLDQHWRSHSMLMNNLQTGRSTELVYEGFKFRGGLTENNFTTNALRRAR